MSGLKQRFFETIQDKARREKWPWFNEADDLDELCRKIGPTDAVLALVEAMSENQSGDLDIKVSLQFRDQQWAATADFCNDISVGVFGETPQRAVLRLALALITKPKSESLLKRLLGVDDLDAECAISFAEAALRKIDHQFSDGSGSVEQCQ